MTPNREGQDSEDRSAERNAGVPETRESAVDTRGLPNDLANRVAALAADLCEVPAAVVAFDCLAENGRYVTILGHAGINVDLPENERDLERVTEVPLYENDIARGTLRLFDSPGTILSREQELQLASMQSFAALLLHQRRAFDRVLAELRAAEHQVDEQHAREHLAITISSSGRLRDALSSTVPEICKRYSWDYAQIWEVSDHHGALACSNYQHTAATPSDGFDLAKIIDSFHFASRQLHLSHGSGQPGISWSTRAPAWNETAQIDDDAGSAHDRAVRAAGFNTSLTIPILAGEDAVAVIELLSFERKVQDDTTGKLVSMLMRTFGETALREHHRTFEAHYSPLTHLPNEEHFRELTNVTFRSVARTNGSCAVIRINIDDLRDVNNSFGLPKGNFLITSVAEQLKALVRPGDVLAHYGGGNFALSCPVRNEGEALERSHDALKATRIQLDLGEKDVPLMPINGHVGLSIYPRDGDSVDVIVRNANNAHDQAMQYGKNSIIPFNPQMHEEVQHRLRVENELRRAIERNELSVLYQPKVELSSGRVIGAEALLRWKHPELGEVSPIDFIPIAERTKLIQEIGAWVLRRSCEEARALRREGMLVTIAVNISAYEFQKENLVAHIARTLEETGLDPSGLQLEITESAAIQNLTHAIVVLARLRSMGIRIALDDFGTGHSSLSQLRHLPIDILKIDQTFVRDMIQDDKACGIVQSIIDLASNLRLATVAEGVETADQAMLLRQMGCTEGQGYFFGRPMNESDLRALIRVEHRDGEEKAIPN